jgi:translation initiation factor IF-1
MSENDPKTAEPISLDELDSAAGGAANAGIVEVNGTVVEALPNALFQVDLENGKRVRAHVWGKLRMAYIRILPGHRVTVQLNPDDPSWARIVWRFKS